LVCGLRKVLLGKKIIILSSKNLIVLISIKKTIFLIPGIHFTYKFIIPDIKTKQNTFLSFLKYWSSSHGFNKLVIKAKIHAKIYFLKLFFAWKYDMIFLRDLVVCMKIRLFFCFIICVRFWRKPDILIPDSYLYGIKIQTDINQNG
jgi:hypothetical protein